MKDLTGAILAAVRAGRGRALPTILLGLAALLLLQLDETPLISVRQAQFDHYQRMMPRARPDEPVIVVGIDSSSLARHGQWPWPRDLIARLVDRIQAGKPLALGIDIVFAERDRYSPEVLADRLAALPEAALASLPDPDRQLADALSGPPAVLAVVGLSNPLPGSTVPARPLQVFRSDAARDGHLPRFAAGLASRPLIERAAAGEGLINASPAALQGNAERGVLRQVPTLAFVADLPFLSLPLEMTRQALGGIAVEVIGNKEGMSAIRVGDYRLPTLPNGEVLLHFGRASSSYYLSANDVLAGVHPPDLFASRFVIIGFNATGLQDRIVTPLGESLPGVDAHVQVIESLLASHALQRPNWLRLAELAALLIIGLLLIVFIPTARPRFAVLGFALSASFLVVTGYVAFVSGALLFDGMSPILLLSPAFISLLGNTLIAADTRRREAERQLQQSREEAARMAGELGAARRIQMGLLPDLRTQFPGEDRFSAAAALEPALAVGGDYYDCFMLDAQRLCFAIGDVSGKGLPASLFMAISKTLTGTLARRQNDVGIALREIEAELSRENPEFLFVTALVGVIDVDTGRLAYACAGHDAPLLLRQGSIIRLDTSSIAGPPLCAAGDYPFVAAEFSLEPGDLICLFTDGVTEASNGQAFFGCSRLSETLLALEHRPVAEQTNELLATVRRFEAGHPPTDDLTLMLLRWNGLSEH